MLLPYPQTSTSIPLIGSRRHTPQSTTNRPLSPNKPANTQAIRSPNKSFFPPRTKCQDSLVILPPQRHYWTRLSPARPRWLTRCPSESDRRTRVHSASGKAPSWQRPRHAAGIGLVLKESAAICPAISTYLSISLHLSGCPPSPVPPPLLISDLANPTNVTGVRPTPLWPVTRWHPTLRLLCTQERYSRRRRSTLLRGDVNRGSTRTQRAPTIPRWRPVRPSLTRRPPHDDGASDATHCRSVAAADDDCRHGWKRRRPCCERDWQSVNQRPPHQRYFGCAGNQRPHGKWLSPKR